MVSKITALYDWQFEEDNGYAEVNDFAMMISKKAVNSFVRTPFCGSINPFPKKITVFFIPLSFK